MDLSFTNLKANLRRLRKCALEAGRRFAIGLFVSCGLAAGFGQSAMAATSDPSPTSLFSPVSTPAYDIYHLSLFVLSICAAIFVVVFTLIAYAALKFRKRATDDDCEPPQIYGSNQVELAWTVIPILIVVVLFLASARVIHAVEDAQFPPDALEVTAIGHQFWWEFRYPGYGFVTANELHVPVSPTGHPTPTHIILLSADTDHSFWVPKLAGKTDLIPNHRNEMWIDPHDVGHYLGPMRAVLRGAARQDAAERDGR